MSRPSLKHTVYTELARLGKAIASPIRLELLDLLAQTPRTVEALARQTEQNLANVSQHLQVLRAARLVEAEKEGLYVTYRLAGDEVGAFYRSLRGLGEARLSEIEDVARTYRKARGQLEPVDHEALIARVQRGEVTVLDVRPAEEFAAGHLPGALSIPIAELQRRLDALPTGKEVVAYCRGPYCVYALDAVKLLRSKGFSATRLEDGVPEWRARGLSVEISSLEARS